MAKTKQLRLLKYAKSAYGGELQKRRAGRAHGRPLSTRETMHLVLRSTKAKGAWSFLRGRNDATVRAIISKFADRYGVRVVSMANVGNHLHLQIKLASRFTYFPFIRAVTGGIAMAITGSSRWSKESAQRPELSRREVSKRADESICEKAGGSREKFWDRRPFTRIVRSFVAYKNLKNYVRINALESLGFSKAEARQMLEVERKFSG